MYNQLGWIGIHEDFYRRNLAEDPFQCRPGIRGIFRAATTMFRMIKKLTEKAAGVYSALTYLFSADN